MSGRAAGALLVTAMLSLAACSEDVTADPPAAFQTSSSHSTTTAPGATTSAGATATAAAEGTVITVRDSDYGPMLFDGRNQAIYLFTKETTSTPACYEDCASAWPPVLTVGVPR